METKSDVRDNGKAARARISPKERGLFSARISENCQTGLAWANYRQIHIFLTIEQQAEVDTWPLINWIWQNHPQIEIYVPVLRSGLMEHFAINPETSFTPGKFDIPEPADGKKLDGDQLDLIFVPLLGFDDSGNRVGYGGGYYDRFLNEQPDSYKVGLAYESLAIPGRIETERHDVSLDAVITESKIHNFARK